MTSQVRVRDAQPADGQAWRAIVLEAAAEEPTGIVTRAEEVWTPAAFAEKVAATALRADEEALLVAERDALVVGVLGLRRGRRVAERHTAELGVTIARAARRTGVGTALIAAAEARAASWGVQKICLGVFARNAAARALYARLGYAEEGLRRGQYLFPTGPVDEVLMAKQVGPSTADR